MNSLRSTEEILPSIPCSRNLRRRTGIWLGVEAWELFCIALLSILPDLAYRVGMLETPRNLPGILLSAAALGFVIMFKRNKPPHYFSLWFHHHFIHPSGWRSPKSDNRRSPILDETDETQGVSP
ncbi:MAG: hypothetical protein PHV34_14720 [Verrucomicrobiae bacterium]|nr:hypothetical protein [Verrucomicrobiae bacterium]